MTSNVRYEVEIVKAEKDIANRKKQTAKAKSYGSLYDIVKQSTIPNEIHRFEREEKLI